jgi:hypothetical protein
MIGKSMFKRITALLSGVLVLGASFTAAATYVPGSYVYWNFDGVSGLSDVAYTVTVTRDPSHAAQVFWSNQVDFSNGVGAYAGMQTNGGAQRLFLFSVWDVTEAVAGPGSWCEPFGGEGVGMSCRRWGDWKEGDTYEFHYVAEGNGWWGMTVTNLSDHTSFKLGSIKVGSDTMKPASISWTEYFRWNDAASSCASEPYSRARFDAPLGNSGALTARITGTDIKPECPASSTVTTTGGYAVHTNAIGNSVMSTITGSGGNCLDVANGRVISYPCHGGDNQQWVYAYDDTLRAKDYSCAIVSGGSSVRAGSCTSSRRTWRVNGTQLIERSSGKCLTAGANGTTVTTCNGSANQQWNVPARER